MSIKEINLLLTSARRPIEIFGKVSTEEELNKKYRLLSKICHPDLVSQDLKELASDLIKILNSMHEEALKEMKDGIYYITDKKELYRKKKPIIEFEIDSFKYKFYENIRSEDVSDIYVGLCEDKIVYLKICRDEVDNELIDNEFQILRDLEHPSIPKIKDILKINGKSSIIFEEYIGLELNDLKKEYGNISGEHVAWMLERMLSVIGYLHDNKIIHGNIKPENIIINPDNHNVILLDYSLCITSANEENSRYKIINKNYTPNYVDSNARPYPNADIYSVGKVAVNLLGGDVENCGMPMGCDSKIRDFIRKLISGKENDAWVLWDELINIRNNVYGTQRFQKLERKL